MTFEFMFVLAMQFLVNILILGYCTIIHTSIVYVYRIQYTLWTMVICIRRLFIVHSTVVVRDLTKDMKWNAKFSDLITFAIAPKFYSFANLMRIHAPAFLFGQ